MRLDVDPPDDGAVHQYCLECRAEAVERVWVGERTYYACRACGVRAERSLVIDPGIRWWVDADGEYWHESAGVFVGDGSGRILLFERTIFPFQMSVPAGHVDAGEEPGVAAVRELVEEVGLRVPVRPVGVLDVVGDQCRRGADAHRWHAYAATVPAGTEVTVREEGARPVWLSPDQARAADLTVPVRRVIDAFAPTGVLVG